MHEFSIATSIVEAVQAFAEANAVRKVLEVRLLVGELTCVATDQLKFCFEAITRDSIMENAILEIDSAYAAVRCSRCGYEGPPKYWDDAQATAFLPTLECPGCGRATEAVAGHDCAIKSVRFVRDEDSEKTAA